MAPRCMTAAALSLLVALAACSAKPAAPPPDEPVDGRPLPPASGVVIMPRAY